MILRLEEENIAGEERNHGSAGLWRVRVWWFHERSRLGERNKEKEFRSRGSGDILPSRWHQTRLSWHRTRPVPTGLVRREVLKCARPPDVGHRMLA